MHILFPVFYAAALTYLVWKAYKVMSHGWGAMDRSKNQNFKLKDTTRKYSIHPELLDKSGNITNEELLTVRFSNDKDNPLEKGSTHE